MKAFISFLLLCSCFCLAQAPPEAIRIFVSATDKQDRPLPRLGSSDLTIGDGKHAGTVLDVQKYTGPIHFCVLLDTSNSSSEDFKFEQETAVSFLTHIPRPNVDTAVVLAFDTKTEASTETSDPAQLVDYVRSRRAGGATALYDATVACSHRLESAPPQDYRAIVVLADGDDNISRNSSAQAIEAALSAGAHIYAFWTSDSEINRKYLAKQAKALNVLTNATGGELYGAHVGRPLQDFKQRLQTLFAVTYRPAAAKADGKLHRIAIQAPKGINATAPLAYLASGN